MVAAAEEDLTAEVAEGEDKFISLITRECNAGFTPASLYKEFLLSQS